MRAIKRDSHLIFFTLGVILYTAVKCYAHAKYGDQRFFTPELPVVIICALLMGFLPNGSIRRHGCKTLLMPGFTIVIFIINNVAANMEIEWLVYAFFIIGMIYGTGFDFLCSEPKELKDSKFSNYKGRGRQ